MWISALDAGPRFQLTEFEAKSLTSQIVMSKKHGRGGRRSTLIAFTEQGVAMLSSVLRSERAIAVNVELMRAFVRLRREFTANKELARQLAALEARVDKRLTEHDVAIVDILNAIRALMRGPNTPTRPIGFVRGDK
jgi:hypothetical protein